MAIENFFADASSVMTVISFVTFIGILWWVYGAKSSADFDVAANLPFADDDENTSNMPHREMHHG